jgi:hypothetical protein
MAFFDQIYQKNNQKSVSKHYFLAKKRVSKHCLRYPVAGDFWVDRRFLFEVGGKGKTFEQIKDQPDSFLALDDTEVGRGNRIPLWMFGFLY